MGPSEVEAFKGGVRSTRMPQEETLEGFLEPFLQAEIFLPPSWSFHHCVRGVRRNVVVGGAVSLHFCVLLLLGNDDVVSVPADVDDVVEIGRRKVIEVARLLLLCSALPSFGAFGVLEPATLRLGIVLSSDFTVPVASRTWSGSSLMLRPPIVFVFWPRMLEK